MTEQKMCCGTTCDKSVVADYIAKLEREVVELSQKCEKLRQERDELAAQSDQIKFRLVDSVRLAAVVAFPDTHQDASWQRLAKSHMKAVRELLHVSTLEADNHENHQESSN